MTALGFDVVEPDLADVAGWTARGLTAYDAAYVAVAHAAGLPLVTDDRDILRVAEMLAVPVTDAAAAL